MPARIKTGDEVIIVSGKDRGKKGKVLRMDLAKQRVYVEGLNMIKRHEKPRQMAGQRAESAGGVIVKEGPVHVSNVMLLDPKDGKPTRTGVEIENGKRFRIARRSGTRLD